MYSTEKTFSPASNSPSEAAGAAADGAQEPDGAQEDGALESEDGAQESEDGARGAEAAQSAAAGPASLVRAAQGAAVAAVFRGELAASFAKLPRFSDCVERRSGSVRTVIDTLTLRLCPLEAGG